MAKERMTIDKLAERMDSGFKAVLKRLDTHAEMISSVAEDVTDIRTQLNRMEPKLDSTIARLDDHGMRIEQLEKTREP